MKSKIFDENGRMELESNHAIIAKDLKRILLNDETIPFVFDDIRSMDAFYIHKKYDEYGVCSVEWWYVLTLKNRKQVGFYAITEDMFELDRTWITITDYAKDLVTLCESDIETAYVSLIGQLDSKNALRD